MNFKNVFNGAAGYTGALISSFGLMCVAMNPSALTVGIAAGGALLFAAGYSNFFGSGKTSQFLKKALDNTAADNAAPEQPAHNNEAEPISKVRTGFNAAACYVGGGLGAASGFIYLINTAFSGMFGGSYEPTDGQTATYAAMVAAGIGLYALGQSRFFGSGKTMAGIKNAVDRMQPSERQDNTDEQGFIETLEKLRQQNPNLEREIQAVVDAEAAMREEDDPAQGQIVTPQPQQRNTPNP